MKVKFRTRERILKRGEKSKKRGSKKDFSTLEEKKNSKTENAKDFCRRTEEEKFLKNVLYQMSRAAGCYPTKYSDHR